MIKSQHNLNRDTYRASVPRVLNFNHGSRLDPAWPPQNRMPVALGSPETPLCGHRPAVIWATGSAGSSLDEQRPLRTRGHDA